MNKQKVSLIDGRAGTINARSQNGHVLVTFPYFVVNNIADIPPPSEVKNAFQQFISVDELIEDSRQTAQSLPYG